MAEQLISGEDMAWQILAGLSPEEVCRKTGARPGPADGTYFLTTFGKDFLVDPAGRVITSPDPSGDILLTRLVYFYRLSALWYLVKSQEVEPTGRLVKPESLPGGDMFFKGSHVLPLNAVAQRYGSDRQGFLSRTEALSGIRVEYGDAAVELAPFPRVPVTLILWLKDDEWDARADLLFDSTAPVLLPVDILWSIAMMSVLICL